MQTRLFPLQPDPASMPPGMPPGKLGWCSLMLLALFTAAASSLAADQLVPRSRELRGFGGGADRTIHGMNGLAFSAGPCPWYPGSERLHCGAVSSAGRLSVSGSAPVIGLPLARPGRPWTLSTADRRRTVARHFRHRKAGMALAGRRVLKVRRQAKVALTI